MARRKNRRSDEETTYWLSYSDMMAALLLTFVLIIAFTMMQSKKQYEEKEEELKVQQELVNEQESELEEQRSLVSEQKKQMELQENELVEQESELSAQQEALEKLRSTLGEQESEMIAQQEALDKLQLTLGEQESELVSQREQLSKLMQQNETKEVELEEQQAIVKSQQKVMEQQQEKLDKLVGIRSELIEALKQEFDDTELSVRIDPQTGAIAFDSSIMFDYNDAQLKESGTAFLVEFLPRYLNILMNDTFKNYISEIMIEGHTDTSGSYLFNLELSQRRALSVANFCLRDDQKFSGIDTTELRKMITANGRSFSDPVLYEDGTVNMDASRRVEFKFRLKDEDMIKEMINILAEELQTEERE